VVSIIRLAVSSIRIVVSSIRLVVSSHRTALTTWPPVTTGVLDAPLCDKGWWLSLGTLVSATNKTDNHESLLWMVR
jgi:hypothetical protein